MRPFDTQSGDIKFYQQTQETRQRNELTCLYTNVTSVENKIDEFKVLCDECKPDFMGITEPWFKVTSVVEIKGFSISQ